jgi:hypothetical protein
MNSPKLRNGAPKDSFLLPCVPILAFYGLTAELPSPLPSESLPSITSQIPVNRCVFSPFHITQLDSTYRYFVVLVSSAIIFKSHYYRISLFSFLCTVPIYFIQFYTSFPKSFHNLHLFHFLLYFISPLITPTRL